MQSEVAVVNEMILLQRANRTRGKAIRILHLEKMICNEMIQAYTSIPGHGKGKAMYVKGRSAILLGIK